MERLVVTSILSVSWGGTVFAATTEGGKPLRVRTWEPTTIAIGDTLEVEGSESVYRSEHGDYRQIEASALFRIRTSGRLIVPWLMTLEGVGRQRADALFKYFGNDVAAALSEPTNLSRIASVLSPTRPMLGRKLAEYVLLRFARRFAEEEVGVSELEFLNQLEAAGVDDRQAARRLWRLIGSRDAFTRLLARPYAVASVIPWKEADAVGLRLLKRQGIANPLAHEERLLGAVDSVWRATLKDGHTALTRPRLEALVRGRAVTARIAVDTSIEHRRTIVLENGMLAAPGASFLEREVAANLGRLKSASPFVTWEGEAPKGEFTLNLDQMKAVQFLRQYAFGTLQGGAGVGKTTIMRVLCDWHVAAGGSVVQATIAGKAALRLSRATGRVAMTIARLVGGLERRRSLEDRGEIASEQLPRIGRETLLIIDEASMVDLVSWRRLLQFVPSGARVVIVGDVAQLPPVGLGRIYHDIVEVGSGVANLTSVMRQAAHNPIVGAAALIRSGKVPRFEPYGGAELGIQLVSCSQPDAATVALKIYRDLAANTTSEDILMLSGRRDTCSAIAKSMQSVRQANGAKGVRLGPLATWVGVGDPVVATTNRYDEALMNGQLGWVEQLDPLRVRLDGESVGREISMAARLDLASGWCLTVHRAQGSETKRVVIILDAPSLISREWLYTAVTRGIEQVVLVGPSSSIASGISRRDHRSTGFLAALQQTMSQ